MPGGDDSAQLLELHRRLLTGDRTASKVIGQWLEQRRISTLLPLDQRDLLGGLIAYRGYGIIFVCGSDDPEEQRLTVAHEVAHFLADYLYPRQQVIHALGEHMTEVLDGLRNATPSERAAAILSHLRLGAHTHLLQPSWRSERLVLVSISQTCEIGSANSAAVALCRTPNAPCCCTSLRRPGA